MTEKCPHCGKGFENTKALGSHIHYMHNNIYVKESRSEVEQERFLRLLNGCLSDRDLSRPRNVDKIEQAIAEIPQGVSPTLDKYRDAFKCAITKGKLLEEVEEELLRDLKTEDSK